MMQKVEIDEPGDTGLIAKDTVDIRGIGFYTLGSTRKTLDDEQKSKYSDLFEQYFFLKQ